MGKNVSAVKPHLKRLLFYKRSARLLNEIENAPKCVLRLRKHYIHSLRSFRELPLPSSSVAALKGCDILRQ